MPVSALRTKYSQYPLLQPRSTSSSVSSCTVLFKQFNSEMVLTLSNIVVFVYGTALVAPNVAPKLEGHIFSATACSVHSQLRSVFRRSTASASANLRTRLAVMTSYWHNSATCTSVFTKLVSLHMGIIKFL